MGDATVNGDLPQSSTLTHISSYPVVSDTVETFKSYPAGQKSIDLTNSLYGKVVKPTLPYFSTPASYVSPYVAKADELGDKFLTKFDEKVPIVKSETQEIKSSVLTYANWPLQVAGDTKEWVLSTFNEEYKKCGGNGLVAGGKALVTSSLIITSETLQWFSAYLSAKKDEATEFAKEAKAEAEKKAKEFEKEAREFAKEAKAEAEKQADQ